MIVKVCGLREPENIADVERLGADMIGFIFYPRSPRYVQMLRARAGIIPDYSEERLRQLSHCETPPPSKPSTPARRVGVFVDDMPQNIVTRVYNYNLDYIQLHGTEPRTTCENLRRTIDPDIHPGIRIIKAISVSVPEDIDKWREYEGVVDLLLFDTKCDGVGGSGCHFDWGVLQRYNGDIPFLLSGGIGPDDAAHVLQFRHPLCIGIDINSKFETSPGVKDINRLATFIKEIRNEQNKPIV